MGLYHLQKYIVTNLFFNNNFYSILTCRNFLSYWRCFFKEFIVTVYALCGVALVIIISETVFNDIFNNISACSMLALSNCITWSPIYSYNIYSCVKWYHSFYIPFNWFTHNTFYVSFSSFLFDWGLIILQLYETFP